MKIQFWCFTAMSALATLKEGETVLDLCSGGGIDTFLAAKKVDGLGKI